MLDRIKTIYHTLPRNVQYVVILLGGIVLYLFTGVFSKHSHEEITQNKKVTPAVEVMNMEATDYNAILNLKGVANAYDRIVIKSRTSGTVEKCLCQSGDSVNKDQLLIELSEDTRKEDLEAAKVALDYAQSDWQNTISLANKSYSAKINVDAAASRVASAKAGYAKAMQDFKFAKVTSPADALVDVVNVQEGSIIQNGEVLINLLVLDPIQFDSYVSESEYLKLKKGMKVEVTTQSGEKLEGEITGMAQAADVRVRSYKIEITASNPTLKIKEGMSVKIKVPVETVKAHFVPVKALSLADDGSVGVKAIDKNNRVIFYPINIGDSIIDEQGVWAKGLPEKITGIVTGHQFVKDGVIVNPTVVNSKKD